MTIRKILCAGACVAALAGMAVPTVSDVVVQPRWPWSTKVDVHFVLSGVTGPVEAVCTFKNDGVALNAPAASLSGDLADLQNGAYTITWDPVAAGYGTEKKLSALTAEISTVATKLYMIVDLKSSLADTAEARVSYTNEVIGANGRWDDYYKTNCVVFRRIKAGSFTMGAKTSESNRGVETGFRRQVTLTKDFYIGVFEIPQAVYKMFKSHNWPYPYKSGEEFIVEPDFRPVSRVGYEHLRGDNWSCTNTLAEAREVSTTYWIGLFRETVGGSLQFDLPTEAQWEYACRAGTDASYYNGKNVSMDVTHDANLDSIARYRYNGGYLDNGATAPSLSTATTANGTAKIGSYEPNAWGLYDMLGNVEEWVLDWAATATTSDLFDEAKSQTVDPRGPRQSNDMTNKMRVTKGGSWNLAAGCTTSKISGCYCGGRSIRKSGTAARNEQYAGFRLCLTPNEY